jgi:hypothetical protein
VRGLDQRGAGLDQAVDIGWLRVGIHGGDQHACCLDRCEAVVRHARRLDFGGKLGGHLLAQAGRLRITALGAFHDLERSIGNAQLSRFDRLHPVVETGFLGGSAEQLLVDVVDAIAQGFAAKAGSCFRRGRECVDDQVEFAFAGLEHGGPVGETRRIGRTTVIRKIKGVDGIAGDGCHGFLVLTDEEAVRLLERETIAVRKQKVTIRN